ncbi:hypothetical protein NRIC0776_11710 [Apilactobacillus kunkeei]
MGCALLGLNPLNSIENDLILFSSQLNWILFWLLIDNNIIVPKIPAMNIKSLYIITQTLYKNI